MSRILIHVVVKLLFFVYVISLHTLKQIKLFTTIITLNIFVSTNLTSFTIYKKIEDKTRNIIVQCFVIT